MRRGISAHRTPWREGIGRGFGAATVGAIRAPPAAYCGKWRRRNLHAESAINAVCLSGQSRRDCCVRIGRPITWPPGFGACRAAGAGGVFRGDQCPRCGLCHRVESVVAAHAGRLEPAHAAAVAPVSASVRGARCVGFAASLARGNAAGGWGPSADYPTCRAVPSACRRHLVPRTDGAAEAGEPLGMLNSRDANSTVRRCGQPIAPPCKSRRSCLEFAAASSCSRPPNPPPCGRTCPCGALSGWRVPSDR